ncbi:MAG TPA: hypothetical protein VGQ39_02660 [Pyrinomonadaceae bacterium]|jgi:hypothetical protein|nr:hypothetical protein [Pyrinomonadaceae bacterium]
MKRVLVVLIAGGCAVFATATVISFAQQPQPVTQDNVVVKQRVVQAREDGPPPPPGGDFIFMASEINFGGKVVKGAAYSAQAVTETIQTLGDGNRIVNKFTSSLYRDNEGRTRREQTIKMLGPLGDGGEPLQSIFINDPVAGVSYSLDPRTHIAHKTLPFKLTQKLKPIGPGEPGMPPHGVEGHRLELKIEGGPESTVVVKAPPPGASAIGHTFNIQTDGGGGMTYAFRRKGPNDNEKNEQLGKQIIEGVEAEGTRSTITIPTGEIGNERPIEIVNESWYSPELQTVVMTRHSDPRSGELVYRLIDIDRSEPAKSLFEVPADYTVKENFARPAVMPLPAKVRKPE